MIPYLRSITKQHWKTAALFCAALALLTAFGVQGFEHGRVNNFRDQSIQLPIIYSYENPALFNGDVMMEARDSYVTLFYPGLGYAARYLDLSKIMLGLYILTLFVTLSAVYSLGETLFPDKNIGMFATMFWLAYYPNLGGDYIHSPFVTHSTMAIAFSLWAVVLILRGYPLWAALLLGVTANINAMTVFFVTFMWAFALSIEILSDFKANFKRKYLAIPFIMALGALPVLLWRMSLPLSTEEATLDLFVHIMRVRLWYAVFPFSVNIVLWVGFFVMLVAYLFSWRFGVSSHHRRVVRMQMGIALLCGVGLVFSEIIPIEFVIQLQLIRSSWLINLFIAIYLAHMAREALYHNTQRTIILAFALVGAIAAPRMVMALVPYTHPAPFTLYADFTSPFINALSPTAEMGVAAIIILLLASVWWKAQKAFSLAHWQTIRRTVLWFGFAALVFTVPMFIEPNVPDSQFKTEADWEETLIWIEGNTEVEAMFFTPPTTDGFRMGAKRSHLGNWKDGTVGIFNNTWVINWYEKMIDFGFQEADFSFRDLNQNDICNIIHTYQPDYLVLWQRWGISGDPLYHNDSFEVVAAPDVDCNLYIEIDPNSPQTLNTD